MLRELSRKIARDLFAALDLGNDKCKRLAGKGGTYPDKETELGGWCEDALAEQIEKALKANLAL